jgi:hypothetical protein
MLAFDFPRPGSYGDIKGLMVISNDSQHRQVFRKMDDEK